MVLSHSPSMGQIHEEKVDAYIVTHLIENYMNMTSMIHTN